MYFVDVLWRLKFKKKISKGSFVQIRKIVSPEFRYMNNLLLYYWD